MGKLLTEFQQSHPAVAIDLQLNDRKIDIIEEGFDVALRIGHLKNSSLIAKRIAPVRLVVCASPDYLDQYGRPQTIAELQQHRYLRYSYIDQSGPLQELHTNLLGTGDRRGDLISNNGDVLIQSAIAGAGIAIQPTFICGSALKSGALEQVLPHLEPAPLGLYAVYAHRQWLPNKVRCFIDFMDNYYGTPPYWDRFDQAD